MKHAQWRLPGSVWPDQSESSIQENHNNMSYLARMWLGQQETAFMATAWCLSIQECGWDYKHQVGLCMKGYLARLSNGINISTSLALSLCLSDCTAPPSEKRSHIDRRSESTYCMSALGFWNTATTYVTAENKDTHKLDQTNRPFQIPLHCLLTHVNKWTISGK